MQQGEEEARNKCVSALLQLEEREQEFMNASRAYMQVKKPEWWYVNQHGEVEGPCELETMSLMYGNGLLEPTDLIMLSHWSTFYTLDVVYPQTNDAFHAMVPEPDTGADIYPPPQLNQQEAAQRTTTGTAHGPQDPPGKSTEQNQSHEEALRRYFQSVYMLWREDNYWDEDEEGDNDECYDEGDVDMEDVDEGDAGQESEEEHQEEEGGEQY